MLILKKHEGIDKFSKVFICKTVSYSIEIKTVVNIESDINIIAPTTITTISKIFKQLDKNIK